ncbi:MAG: hypothetical protein JO277_09695 [Candidatus Eremiobacteraeota bacterium]|nr:hypothetical protein [Candidatus Eremiobacteraeota bacterium]
MLGAGCTYETHDALRADPLALRRSTTPAGVQLDETGDVLFELRVCTCGSHLAAPVEEGVPVHVEDDGSVLLFGT